MSERRVYVEAADLSIEAPPTGAVGRTVPHLIGWSIGLLGLYAASLHSYLLFHSIAELFSIVVAAGIFLIVWNARAFLANDYLLFMGTASLFVGFVDLLHTLAYKGMGVFPGTDANLATQLWIAARYMGSVSFIAAPVFLKRRVRLSQMMAAYLIVTALALLSIFAWHVFPTCYVEGAGLTPFKRASEYVIAALLVAAGGVLLRHRRAFEPHVLHVLLASILFSAASELTFTRYFSVYDVANLLGHFLKILSFALLYLAIIQTGLRKPYDLLFRELKEGEARLNAVLRQMPAGVLLVDPAGRVLTHNAEAERIWRLSFAGMETLADFTGRRGFHADGRPYAASEWPLDRTIGAGEAVTGREIRIRRGDGTDAVISVNAAPIRDAAGAIIAGVATFTDVTDRKTAEDVLKRSKGELELRVAERTAELSATVYTLEAEVKRRTAAEEQLRALSAELAVAEQRERQRLARILHDGLQQLLVACRMRAGLLERARDLGVVRDGCRELANLLQQALGSSRSLTAELSPPILATSGLLAALEWLGRWMKETHHLSVDLHAVGAVATDDEATRVLLFQSVRELLFNTVKHARIDSARVDIGEQDGRIRIVVSDQGAGFDPDRGQAGGSGLGLASIRQRLQFLGGDLEVASAPGNGSRFVLSVPVRSQVPPESASAQPTQSAAQPAARIRVIVADDHLVVRQAIARMLAQERDVEVVAEASNGEEAVHLARQLQPDVVVMDVNMPRLSGIEATRAIRRAAPSVQVVGLSMFDPDGDAQTAMQAAGAVAYVSKAGASETLLTAIRTCMAREGR